MHSSRRCQLPLTEHIGDHEVTLPLFPSMRPEDVEYVVECLQGCVDTGTASV
jgi:dTDP-4-amino-4,6-dideoxygalactose transaminase